MQNQPTPAPVNPVELLTRQLRDWKQLHDDLCQQPGKKIEVDYCWAQIQRIESELSNFNLK